MNTLLYTPMDNYKCCKENIFYIYFSILHLYNIYDYKINSNDIYDIYNEYFETLYLYNIYDHKLNNHKVSDWNFCGYPCSYKSIAKGNLKTHKSNIHDKNTTFYHCEYSYCDFKTKYKNNLEPHKKKRHNTKCETCFRISKICNKNDRITNNRKICINCYKWFKNRRKKDRIEKIIIEKINRLIDDSNVVRANKAIKTKYGGTCGCRPDQLYFYYGNLAILLEIDENAHRYYKKDKDKTRMDEICAQECMKDKYIVIIRLNPDSYKPKPKYEYTIDEKVALYVQLHNKILQTFNRNNRTFEKDKYIFYMFYSKNNHNIDLNSNYTMLYNTKNIKDLNLNVYKYNLTKIFMQICRFTVL